MLPEGPFDQLQLGVRVVDVLDGSTFDSLDMNAAASGDCTLSASCTARAVGAVTSVLWGRLVMASTSAPEDTNLHVPIHSQFWDGAAFRAMSADQCSLYSAAQATLSSHTDNLDAGETTATAPAVSTALVDGMADPSAPLQLAAPGFGNDGSVTVTLDVADWLEFDWFGSGDTDPSAVQSFGRLRGHDRVVYWDEITR